MNRTVKNILKILLIGLATTIVRIIGQLSIPAGEQTVLEPSIFAQNGTMPLVFTVYGVFAYSLIASLFLIIRNRLSGNRVLQGLKYGFSCCIVWIVYCKAFRQASSVRCCLGQLSATSLRLTPNSFICRVSSSISARVASLVAVSS